MPKDKKIFGYFAVLVLVAGLVLMVACTGDSDDEDVPNFSGMDGRWDFVSTFSQGGGTSSSSAIAEAPAESVSTSPNYYTGYFTFDTNGGVTGGYVYLNGSSTAYTITEGKTLVNKDRVTYSLQLTLSSGDVLTIERWAPNASLRYLSGRIASAMYGYGILDAFRYDSTITFGSSSEFAGDWRYYLANGSGTVSGQFSVGYDGTITSGSYSESTGSSGSLTGSISSDTSANVSCTLSYATTSDTISLLSVKLNGSKNALGGIAQATTIGTGRFIAYREPVAGYESTNLPGTWLLTILDQNTSLWYVGVVTINSNLTLSVNLWKSSTASETAFSGNSSITSTGSVSITLTGANSESMTLGGVMNSVKDAIQGFGSSSLESTNIFMLVKLPTTTVTDPATDTTGTTSSFYTYTSYSGYSYSYQAVPMNLWRHDSKIRSLASMVIDERKDT